MRPASRPRSARELRILVVGPGGAPASAVPASALPSLLAPGDLVVINDAATIPASFAAHTATGEPLEVRLAGALELANRPGAVPRFQAALLGRGDFRVRTEDRPPPPFVDVGDVLFLGGAPGGAPGLVARVVALSPISRQLVELDLSVDGLPGGGEPADRWAAIYRVGRPVQYAYVPQALALWDVQNAWASRPWAFEMPSAGRVLDASALLALRARGVGIASVTHAAGLSSTGDPEIDRRLPLPERFEVSQATADAALLARARGGRVVAVGTSVVRALEAAAGRGNGAVSGTTDLRLSPASRRAVVDALLTGSHEADTSHFELLGAFAGAAVLERALAAAEAEGLLGHEFGDAWLVWGERPARSEDAAASATFAA